MACRTERKAQERPTQRLRAVHVYPTMPSYVRKVIDRIDGFPLFLTAINVNLGLRVGIKQGVTKLRPIFLTSPPLLIHLL